MSDPVSDLKQELLAAAERQQRHAAGRAGRTRLRGHAGRKRLLLTSAGLSIAAAMTLVLTAPWSNSTGFLGQAQAALTPPSGMILHEKWEVTLTSTDPACTAARGPSEIWIDETPPYRYRVLLTLPPVPKNHDPRALVCSSGTASEFGGTLDTQQTLMFVPPNTLRGRPRVGPLGRAASGLMPLFPLDPVQELREAISTGRAHDEGETQLDGRTVERIRIDPPSECPGSDCPREASYAYVDPETFYPVQLESPHGYIVLGNEGEAQPSVVRFHFVVRFRTFEYLPRTAANLALTDIRAQHPNATGP